MTAAMIWTSGCRSKSTGLTDTNAPVQPVSPGYTDEGAPVHWTKRVSIKSGKFSCTG